MSEMTEIKNRLATLEESHVNLRLAIERQLTLCAQRFQDLSHLEELVYGDGNGRRGMIRRQDALEAKVNSTCISQRLVIGMLLAILGGVVVNIFVRLT